MYAIYGNIYHQYTPNVTIYTIHGSYGLWDDIVNQGDITHVDIRPPYVKYVSEVAISVNCQIISRWMLEMSGKALAATSMTIHVTLGAYFGQ